MVSYFFAGLSAQFRTKNVAQKCYLPSRTNINFVGEPEHLVLGAIQKLRWFAVCDGLSIKDVGIFYLSLWHYPHCNIQKKEISLQRKVQVIKSKKLKSVYSKLWFCLFSNPDFSNIFFFVHEKECQPK